MGWVARHALLAFGYLHACRAERVDVAPGVTVRDALAPAPIVAGEPSNQTMAVYFTVHNTGDVPDTITMVQTTVAEQAMIHTTMTSGMQSRMAMLPVLAVPPRSTVRLEPGGSHVMLERLTRGVSAGDSIPIVVQFRRAGRVSVYARVVPYDRLDDALKASQRINPRHD